MAHPLVARACFLAGQVAQDGQLPLREMAYSSLATPPKGSYESDRHEVNRSAEETRPLCLRNCDAKTITGAHAFAMGESLTLHAAPNQKGFAPRRQFTDNISELDAHMRIAACGAGDGLFLPAGIAMGYGTVFTVMAHSWLRQIL